MMERRTSGHLESSNIIDTELYIMFRTSLLVNLQMMGEYVYQHLNLRLYGKACM
jgi:hypothetical protein